jgi:hypothetical protein
MNRILLILLLLMGYNSFSQSSDVILLKRKNKTVNRYFSGTDINMVTNTGVSINAYITHINNDTLFLKQFVVRQIPTMLGVFILDTLTTYYYQYHYNQIRAINKTSHRFDLSASAGSLLGGGAILTLAGGVVFLVDREKFSPALMGASVSLAAIGYVLAKASGSEMIIGKKYSLDYLKISDNKKM